jgi:hypothetical protein
MICEDVAKRSCGESAVAVLVTKTDGRVVVQAGHTEHHWSAMLHIYTAD